MTKESAIDCRFIELMPFDGNNWDPNQFVSFTDMKNNLIHGNVGKYISDPSIH